MLPQNDMFSAAQAPLPTPNSKLVAIKKQKMVQGIDGLEFSLLREIKLLQELKHPNIVKLHDVFHLNGLLYFALEYGPINLLDLIQKEREKIILKPEHIKCIMKQILSGLGYLHQNWVMHRDLKPDNMVIDETGTIKIILLKFMDLQIENTPKQRPHFFTGRLSNFSVRPFMAQPPISGPSAAFLLNCTYEDTYLKPKDKFNSFHRFSPSEEQ